MTPISWINSDFESIAEFGRASAVLETSEARLYLSIHIALKIFFLAMFPFLYSVR